jgi:hypothetical protein
MRLQPHTKPVVATTPARDGPSPGVGAQVGRFALHVMQMCAVMCVSLVLLGFLAAGAGALLGLADVRLSAPVLSAVVVTLTLGGSMLAWMRFMDMAWRPTLEMVGSTLLAGAAMVIGYNLGSVPAADLIPGVCGLACVAMIAVMLPRFRMYASHTGHHHHGT